MISILLTLFSSHGIKNDCHKITEEEKIWSSLCLLFCFLSYPWIIFVINRSATIKQICKYLWCRNVKSYVCQVTKKATNISISLICRNAFHSHLKWLYSVWKLVMFCDTLMVESSLLTSEGNKHFLLCLFSFSASKVISRTPYISSRTRMAILYI